MTKKTTAQFQDRTSNRKDPVSIIVLLQDSKAASDGYSIHKGAAIWLVKHYLRGPVKSVIKARVPLPTETARAQESCLKSFHAIYNYLLKRYAKAF